MKHKTLLFYLLLSLAILVFAGCSQKNKSAPKEDPNEILATGAWESGTFYYKDYRIDITGPQVGHPDPDSAWATYYKEDDGDDVNVNFIEKEGSLQDRIEELEAEGLTVTEGVLWKNNCYFYVEENRSAMIPLGDDCYLQVEFIHESGTVVEPGQIPDTFTLTIGEKWY